MMLSFDTAYRSFGGEVEASSTPTICRLSDSRRHQLSAIALRTKLQIEGRARDLAMFNLAIDSKLRACDLVKLRLDDVCSGANVRRRATIVQKKTGRPVQFEITEQSRT